MCNKMSNKVLSILAVFIIQTEHIIFRDKPRLSRNDHNNQEVSIQPCLSDKIICNFINRPKDCGCKTGLNMHQKMILDLPSSKPSRSSCSRYGFFGSSLRYWSPNCLAFSSSITLSATTITAHTTNKHKSKHKYKIK